MSEKQPRKSAGAKPVEKAELVGVELDTQALEARNTELRALGEQEAAITKLATSIGFVGETTPDALWSMVEYRQRRSVEDILEMGRGLLLIKEQTPHGEFQAQCAARGIHQRTGQRLMGVALKFSKSDTMSLLKAAGTQAKVLELAVLEDDELEALNSGESIAGIDLDDVERMSASQLRTKLREARADSEAKDQRITKLSDDLNKEHDKTTKAQRRWKAADVDQQQVILKQSVTEAEQAVLATLGTEKSGLRAAARALADHASENGQDSDAATFLGDMLGRLLTAVRVVRDDEDLSVSVPVINDGEG